MHQSNFTLWIGDKNEKLELWMIRAIFQKIMSASYLTFPNGSKAFECIPICKLDIILSCRYHVYYKERGTIVPLFSRYYVKRT